MASLVGGLHPHSVLRRLIEQIDPPVADDDFVVDDYDLEAVAAGDDATLVGSASKIILPGRGRNVTVESTNVGTGGFVGRVGVTGKWMGIDVCERFDVTVDDGAELGLIPFESISKVEIESVTTAGVANDLLKVGFGNRLGLGFLVPGSREADLDITRLSAGALGATFAGSSNTVDTVYHCLKKHTTLGQGASGAIAANDHFEVRYLADKNALDDVVQAYARMRENRGY